MEYRLSEFAQDLLEDVRRFSIREVRMQAARVDRLQQRPDEILEKLTEIGFTGIFVPDSQNGAGLSLQERAALLGELGRHDAGAAQSVAAVDLAAQPVKLAGTAAQKKYIADILSEGGFAAFCMTEDLAGSDISMIRTKAERTENGYRLNGSKCMVTNVRNAKFLTVIARTDADLSAFLLPADAPGVVRGESEQKMGLRTSQTGSIWFNDVEIPEDALIGEAGQGKQLAMGALDVGRMFASAIAIGIAERALEEAISRIRQRTGFEKPFSDNPVIRTRLAEMYMQKEAAKGTLIHAMENYDGGGQEDQEMLSSASKCLASDAAVACALEAVQLFGGYGYCQDYPVEKLLRDAKAFQIIEGANEIQKLIIGRKLVKQTV